MRSSRLARVLRVEPGQTVLVLNSPEGHLERLSPLPEGATAGEVRDGVADQVQLFAESRAQLEGKLPVALAALTPGGVLWVAYPSPKSNRRSDLSRDHGWGALQVAGLSDVAHATLDGDWDAQQFRRADELAVGGRPKPVPPADMLPVGREASLSFRLVRTFAALLFGLVFRFQVTGREHVPSRAFVAIANHLGWMDAVSLLLHLPLEPRVHFLADPGSMIRNRPLWALVRLTGGIVPVDRTKRGDQALFRHVQRCLERGGAIALFPEGDFGPGEGSILPFKRGFAAFAVNSGAPVLPIALVGMKEIWLGKRLAIHIGEPIPSAGRTVEEVLAAGEEAMRRLIPVYLEPSGAKPLRRWLTGLF